MIGPVLFAFLLGLGAVPSDGAIDGPDLIKRPDLIGRPVTVDERVRYFQSHNKGRDYDELLLKRTPVIFRLPPRLRPKELPRAIDARVRGVLTRAGDDWFCDVEELEILPDDLERLERGLAALAPQDAEGRIAWARWAARRAAAYQDSKIDPRLAERGRALLGEALRIEAERPSADPSARWIALARRARADRIAEPEPSALAHRGLRARLASARTIEEAQAVRDEIEALLPAASKPAPPGADSGPWLARYEATPDVAYRAAPDAVRLGLDHRLWLDGAERLFQIRADADPKGALELADEAAAQLPERPELAERFRARGADAVARDLATLRLREVEALAQVYRDRLKRPERARELVREWLEEQRAHHLSPTDAEGRLALAALYDRLLDDRVRGAELLQDAWKIDPESRAVADAFRRWSFHKVGGRWVPSDRSATGSDTATDDSPRPTTPPRTNRLLGSTPREVRARIGGKPDKVVWSVAQGQAIEQWIYLGPKENQYVNFLRSAADPHSRVVSYYSLPRGVADRLPPRN